MYKHIFVRITCGNCGEVHEVGKSSFLDSHKSFVCRKCHTKMDKQAFDGLHQIYKDISDLTPDFDIEILNEVHMREVDIWRESQKFAETYILETAERKGIEGRNLYELLNDTELMNIYSIGLVVGGFREYHKQLRAALKEQGIPLPPLSSSLL